MVQLVLYLETGTKTYFVNKNTQHIERILMNLNNENDTSAKESTQRNLK